MTYTFKHRCVQDLAWAIRSPPLISGDINGVNWWGNEYFAEEFQACYPLLLKLDKEPAPLLETIAATKSKRLGHYFEALVAYWLTISPNYELLLQSHQLRTPDKTLGEIDFLIQNRNTGKNTHLEVSVKFYLGIGNLNNMANWHGPGLKDRLDKKFNHLREHQTKLAVKHPALMPISVDESACMIKGRLFYPSNTPPGTSFTADEHSFGHWHQLPNLPTSTNGIVQLEKQNWMAQLNYPGDSQTMNLPGYLDQPTLFAAFKGHLDFYSETEQERFFLLPEDFWQQLKKKD